MNVMSWIKIIFINVFVFVSLVAALDIGVGTLRLIAGKDYRIPFKIDKDIEFAASPCVVMRTDVLLSHVPNKPESCLIKDGYAIGEYVLYGKEQNKSSKIPKL